MAIENLLILTDEQLVLMAREGSETAEEILIEKYKGLVRARAKAYFIAGAEAEDHNGSQRQRENAGKRFLHVVLLPFCEQPVFSSRHCFTR